MRGVQAAGGTPLIGPASGPDAGQPAARTAVAAGAAAPRMILVLVSVALMVLGLDIFSKVMVVSRLSGQLPVRLLGGFLTLALTRNSGAAFSIGTSQTAVFTAIAIGVIVFILRASRRIRSRPWAIALGLLLGGATGNLTDRIFRSPGPGRGNVVDWIQLPHWPVFNMADSAIVCGGVLAVLLATRGIGIDGTRARAAGQDDQPPAAGGRQPRPGDRTEQSRDGTGEPGTGVPGGSA